MCLFSGSHRSSCALGPPTAVRTLVKATVVDRWWSRDEMVAMNWPASLAGVLVVGTGTGRAYTPGFLSSRTGLSRTQSIGYDATVGNNENSVRAHQALRARNAHAGTAGTKIPSTIELHINKMCASDQDNCDIFPAYFIKMSKTLSTNLVELS